MSRIPSNITTQEMLAEIKRRQGSTAKLNKKREALLVKIAEIEQAIKAEGGEIKHMAIRTKTGKREKNEMNLPDTMAKVMSKDKAMSVSQIEEAVTKAGYKTTSSTFKTIIFQALGKDKRFKKVERGQYCLK